MNDRQKRFVEEYLIDLNATQAAARAGYEWPTSRDRFYVYFLIDDEQIFYVGKGKGTRISSHRRDRRSEQGNQVKAARLRASVQADKFAEHVFASDLSEPDALCFERVLIKQLRAAGLTNIASGSVHPLESQIARIDSNLSKFRPFEEWDRVAPDYARKFALEKHGTMREFYDWMVLQFTEIRDDCEAKLNLIKGNPSDPARR